MIAAFRDEEGLRIAAAELFEEAFEAPQRAKNAELAEDEGSTPAKDTRTLSEGYYLWLNSVLLTLEKPMEAGAQFREESLWAEELATLMILREARAEFRRKHPPCRGCGKLLSFESQALCADCHHAQLKREH